MTISVKAREDVWQGGWHPPRSSPLTGTMSIKSRWPHLIRHSAATHMAVALVPMEVIQQYLGHEDIETTRRIYARLSPNFLREAAEALDFGPEVH